MKCKPVPLSTLKVGTVLRFPITDPVDPRVILLGKGTQVTQAFIDRLEARGVDTVILSQRDIAILNAFSSQGRRIKVPPAHHYVQSSEHNEYSKDLDCQVRKPDVLKLPLADHPPSAEIHKPSDCAYADGLPEHWAVESAAEVDTLTEFFEDTIQRGSTEIGPLHETCLDILDRIKEDQDALVCHACTPYESDYPSRHGFHLAALAISIGVELGVDREALIDLGIGCLIHDIGMRAIGLEMFDTRKTLSPKQIQRLADHPVKAIEIAGKYGDRISDLSKLVAYQIHERNDGSGYPRGTTAEQIHPLSKIAAVADALVAMLTRRPHRLAIQGYYVMAALLDDMKAGKFDVHVVRALLNVASLYPLGSYVQLNNDCFGRVIRSGGGDFVKPTVEMWHRAHLDRKPAIVNLKHEPGIRITGSVANPKAA